MIVLGLAGVAVFLIVKAGGKTPKQAAIEKRIEGKREILDMGGKRFANGWRYFDDGGSIAPDGTYYFGGQPLGDF